MNSCSRKFELFIAPQKNQHIKNYGHKCIKQSGHFTSKSGSSSSSMFELTRMTVGKFFVNLQQRSSKCETFVKVFEVLQSCADARVHCRRDLNIYSNGQKMMMLLLSSKMLFFMVSYQSRNLKNSWLGKNLTADLHTRHISMISWKLFKVSLVETCGCFAL